MDEWKYFGKVNYLISSKVSCITNGSEMILVILIVVTLIRCNSALCTMLIAWHAFSYWIF